MRKYFIFMIKSDFREIYKHNSKVLYKTLENLYNTKIDSFSYGLSIYEQLCSVIDTNILNRYFMEKFNSYRNNRHVIIDEKTIVEINKSCIVVLSKSNMPFIFKYLLYYNSYLFVCDFYNNDYFWLKKDYSINR